MENTWEILQAELGGAVTATLQMILTAMIISFFIGGALGLILYLTSNKLFFKNKIVNTVSSFIVNIITINKAVDDNLIGPVLIKNCVKSEEILLRRKCANLIQISTRVVKHS